MSKLATGLALFAAFLWSQTGQSRVVNRLIVTDEVQIAAVSTDPLAVSGVVATAVVVSGVTEDGLSTFYIPYLYVGQAKPGVNQICQIRWYWHDDFDWMTVRGSARNVRLINQYSCG